MVIPTANIGLSSVQTEFGGTNPIYFSEYYSNAVPSYTQQKSNIPTIGNTIRISMLSDLAKDINILFTLPGNFKRNSSSV